MPVNTSLPLSEIFPVSVVVSPTAVAGPSFNQALIVGDSTIIPTVGDNSRLRMYESLTSIVADGFSTSSAEYLAAALYFGQTPKPTFLWIGRRDATAIETAIVTPSNGGTAYKVGDIINVVQSGAQGGQLLVTTVSSGVVTGLAKIVGAQGTGYSVAAALSTTGGSGTALEVSITAVGETPLEAVQTCRIVQADWYACMFVGTAVDADHEAIAGFIEAASPASLYFVTTGEVGVPNGDTTTLPGVLAAAKYRRTLTVYATTQGGAAPSNAYAAAGPLGYAMAANNGSAGSYFDLNDKTLAGITPEPLTPTQVVAIRGSVDRSSAGLKCNLVVNYQNNAYTLFQPGTMASGDWFDEVMNLDMLAADIQQSLMNLITSVPALPITDAGVLQSKTVIAGACERAKDRGFISPSGTWTGTAVGSGAGAIAPGDALPKGYFLYAAAVRTLSGSQRSNRVMPAITVLLVEAQSAHSLAVTVLVQK